MAPKVAFFVAPAVTLGTLITIGPYLPAWLYKATIGTLYGKFFEHLPIVWALPYCTDLIHRVAGLVLLLSGCAQFSAELRRKYVQAHRLLGYAFIVSGFITVLTGFYIVLAAPFDKLQIFPILFYGTAILFCTVRGWQYIYFERNRELHREWMIRAFATSLGIGSLRSFYIVLNLTLHRSGFLDVHQTVVTAFWLGWTCALLGGEVYINLTRPQRSAAKGKNL